MIVCRRRKWGVLVFPLAAVLLLLLLGGAGRTEHPIRADECYRKSVDSLLYLRSYYSSGSLKATGSGFIVSEDGLVFTAAHVVKNGERFTAILNDGSELELTLIRSDDDTDLAVLRLPEGTYSALRLADRPPATGAVVRAMGYPLKGTNIITEGIVSAQSGEVSGKERMLVTCDIVNGMSGGPVMNESGRVVGVVSGSIVTMNGIHLSVLSEVLLQAADGFPEVENRSGRLTEADDRIA